LIYKTLVLNGLQNGELKSLTAAHLRLEEAVPFLTLDAADKKNREGNDIALRDDLAADLRDLLADKLRRFQQEALPRGTPIPARLPPDTPIFTVPDALVKILDRDLVSAGLARCVKVNGKCKIDKRDDRGRTLDVHALRTTFGTLMSKVGVSPRTAQAAMRHSKIDLTMNVYTDPALLDVRGALDALPPLPLGGKLAEEQHAKATGTDTATARTLAPTLAPTAFNRGQGPSKAGNPCSADGPNRLDVSGSVVKRKEPLTLPVNGSQSGAGGVRTPDLLNAIQTRSQLRHSPLFAFYAIVLD
jgi:Phage integrase family